ncbi:MAG TPA: hypothetical protein VGS57_04460 [Thermoanaerobaculia bacterium]|jgi:hypothetical protein|nr:hypothetical protein [Thermoanaerobaculia bacterium]
MRDVNYLFADEDLSDLLENMRRAAVGDVERIPEGRLLGVPIDDLVAQLATSASRNPPKLRLEELQSLGAREVKVDVSGHFMYAPGWGEPALADGTEVTIVVPFTGDGELLRYQPSTSTSICPRGDVRGAEIHLTYQLLPHEDAADLKQRLEREVKTIEEYAAWVARDIARFQATLPAEIRSAVEKRRERLHRNADLMDKLGLPVRREAAKVWTFAPPEIRRKTASITHPTSKPGPVEPALPEAVFDHVLEVIERFTIAIERSPRAFAKFGEEELRDMLLVQLNGHYEGTATGETFNASGKTDIYIPYKGKHVFIAECKFWHGKKAYAETIDQLLGYTTWRDSKAAIVVFNKNRDHTAVLATIDEETQQHSAYRRRLEQPTATQFRYVFAHPEDPNRELYLAVVAINLPPD